MALQSWSLNLLFGTLARQLKWSFISQLQRINLQRKSIIWKRLWIPRRRMYPSRQKRNAHSSSWGLMCNYVRRTLIQRRIHLCMLWKWKIQHEHRIHLHPWRSWIQNLGLCSIRRINYPLHWNLTPHFRNRFQPLISSKNTRYVSIEKCQILRTFGINPPANLVAKKPAAKKAAEGGIRIN